MYFKKWKTWIFTTFYLYLKKTEKKEKKPNPQIKENKNDTDV